MPNEGPADEALVVYRDLEGDTVNDLAFEGDLLERAGAGTTSLFLYSWRGPVVVVGYGQKPGDVDLSWCRDHGVPVFRRMSGGTGVVHTKDLALSLFLHDGHPWASGIISLYGRFLGVLEKALVQAGGDVQRTPTPQRGGRVRSPICFEDQLADTLVCGSRKVVGCAQARRTGGVLIHAHISLNLDAAIYADVFRAPVERVRQGLGEAVPGGDPTAVAGELEIAFGDAFGLRPHFEMTPRASAERLAAFSAVRWSLTE